MEGIRKRYLTSGARANDGATLEVRDREIHALVGENGAGKTTLMKILYGLERPDAGRILLDGKAVSIPNPAAAALCGIGMVSQHAEVVGEFTVAQNVSLCAEPRRFAFLYDRKSAEREVGRLAAENGFGLDPCAPASSLSAAEIQELEILKLLWRRASLLILDEPTSLLADHEVEGLFSGLKRLRAAGKTIILITHKAAEVKRIADAVTVMRAGRTFIRLSAADLAEADLAGLMMGSHDAPDAPDAPPSPVVAGTPFRTAGAAGPVVFEMRDVTLARKRRARPSIDGLSLSVRSGEIVGACGLAGNGLAELEDLAAGIVKPTRGSVLLSGRPLPRRREGGRGYVPTDRLWRGSSLYSSVSENLAALDRRSFFPRGFEDRKAVARFADESIGCYDIAGSPTQRLGTLSGGNIQKVILARELAEPKRARLTQARAVQAGEACVEDPGSPFLLFCNPVQGLDLASSAFVHGRLVEERDRGSAILLLSSNLDEILELADRIVVLHRGSAVLELRNGPLVDRSAIEDAMLGLASPEERR
jgi:simple sugar transport system ATP-binding protein